MKINKNNLSINDFAYLKMIFIITDHLITLKGFTSYMYTGLDVCGVNLIFY